MYAYLINLLVSVDQVGSALVGGFPDETLSSYAYRMRLQHKPWGFAADWIDWVARNVFGQANHCYKAHLEVRARVTVPPESR